MADKTDFIVEILQEARPDVDLRPHTPVNDLLIRPHVLLLNPFADDVAQIKLFQSVANAALIPEEDFDKLLANVFGKRQTGSKAIGTARIFFGAPINVRFTVDEVFTSSTGREFSPVQETFVPASQMALQQDGGLFFADVSVIALAEGEEGRLAAHNLTGIRGTVTGFVRVDNPFAFSGGTNRETNAQVLARVKDLVSVRDLVTGRGIRSTLQTQFPQIKRIKIIGYLDQGQDRDIFQGLHIGGQADIFIQADSLLTEEVRIQTPTTGTGTILDGAFALFTAGTPAAAKRPVVTVASVRLLDIGGAPTGAPLQRFETALVVPKALETVRVFNSPHIAVAKSLGTVHVVVAEQADARSSFINYVKLSNLGLPLIAFTRVSTNARSPAKPHIAVSSDGKAFIFWSAQGEVHYTVLNVAGPTFTVIKAPGVLLTGDDELDTMSTSFDGDGNLHIALSRIQAAGTETALLIGGNVRRNLWYAKLTPLGLAPTGFVPKVLAAALIGSKITPRIAAQGTGGAVRATVVFVNNSGAFSNLHAAQANAAGVELTGELGLPLTGTQVFNEHPAVGVDAAGKLMIVWIEDRENFLFMRVNALAGFQVDVPRVALFSRSTPATELTGEVSAADFFQLAWNEGTAAQSDILTTKVHNRGAQVGIVSNVSQTDALSFGPALALDLAGDLHLVWAEGSLLAGKPFYTKRRPQEFSVVTLKPGERFSAQEEIAIATEVAAPNGIGIDIAWAPLVAAVQTFVSDDDNRVVLASLLVRHFVPAEVTVTLTVRGPASLTVAQIQADVTAYLQGLTDNILDPSVLTCRLFDIGATSVEPIQFEAVVDGPSGVLEVFKAKGESLTLPPNASVVVKAINATKKG